MGQLDGQEQPFGGFSLLFSLIPGKGDAETGSIMTASATMRFLAT
jgi:hypothetical protein